MKIRIASIKETGEELSQADWARFDAAVAAARDERRTDAQASVHRLRRENAVDHSFAFKEPAPIRP